MPQQHRVAMTTPWLDATCCGGLSAFVCITILFWGWIAPDHLNSYFHADANWFLVNELLINWPHFMASYRLIYRDRETVGKHPWVAIVVPLACLIAISWTAWTFVPVAAGGETTVLVLRLVVPFAHILLAWHYTGQAWGMTACFAHLGGLHMNNRERLLIRSGMRALFVYHVLWGWGPGLLDSILPYEEAGRYVMQSLMALTRVAIFVTFIAGLWGFGQLAKREQRSIPIRSWLPWAAIFLWYLMLDRHRGTFLLLQVFHALQYLIFPLRVEWNDFTNQQDSTRKRTTHIVLYYALLVILGLIVFDGPVTLTTTLESSLPIAALIAAGVNIHHYFIDSVIWKIRDPRVRQALFGHLPVTR